MGLKDLVGKIALLITVITGGLAQLPIFLTRWPVAVPIISSQGFGRVNLSGRGGALRLGTAGAVIVTISIAPILLVVLARFLSLGGLGAIKKNGLCLVKAEQRGVLVLNVIFGRF